MIEEWKDQDSVSAHRATTKREYGYATQHYFSVAEHSVFSTQFSALSFQFSVISNQFRGRRPDEEPVPNSQLITDN